MDRISTQSIKKEIEDLGQVEGLKWKTTCLTRERPCVQTPIPQKKEKKKK
jgi:hypothetical protein